jgi:chemosensory pili system protein ChpC
MAASNTIINSLIVPLNEQQFIVPQTGLAEVISRETPEAVGGDAQWLKGLITWRGQQIPVISLEELCGREASDKSKDSRFVVLYGVEGIPGLNYYAVEVSGIPHPIKLADANMLMGGAKDKDCSFVAFNVLAEGEEAILLNTSLIERKISEQLQRL